MSPIDKRITPRFRVGPNDYALITGSSYRIRDISLGGIFIEDRDPLQVSNPLLFELHLGGQRLACQGVVRRSVPRTGMGVQFQHLPHNTRDRLQRCLNTLARSLEQTPPPAQGQGTLSDRPDAAPAATGGTDISARLESLTAELRELEEAMKSSNVEGRVLNEFRDSVDQIRTTAWAAQQWVELEAKKGDAYSVLTLLVKERVRRATQLGKDLALDIEASELTFETEGIKDLFAVIDDLYRRLARFFK